MQDSKKILDYLSLRYRINSTKKMQRIEATDKKAKAIHYKAFNKIVKSTINYPNTKEKYSLLINREIK